MPIKSLGSRLPTIEEFLEHWKKVNKAMGGSEFTLVGPYSVSHLQSDRDRIASLSAAVDDLETVLEGSRRDRDLVRESIRSRILQFNNAVRGQFDETPYVDDLRLPPAFKASPEVWSSSIKSVLALWTKIDRNRPAVAGFAPPMKLSDGYLAQSLEADFKKLEAALAAVESIEKETRHARESRDAVFGPVYKKLKQYRLVVKSVLPPESPLLETVPTLTPSVATAEKPFVLRGRWNPTNTRAELSWTFPLSAGTGTFEIRLSKDKGGTSTGDQVLATLDSKSRTFSTPVGLESEGSTAYFRAFWIPKNGHKRRSNTVKVTRPS